MKSLKHLLTIVVISVLILSGCSASSAKSNDNAETSQDSNITMIHEFDHKTNLVADIGDYTIEIPSTWEEHDGFYYKHYKTNNLCMISLQTVSDDPHAYTADDLKSNKDALMEEFAKSMAENYENLETKMVKVNNRDMIYGTFDTTISDIPIRVEVYTVLNPSGVGTNFLIFATNKNANEDYTDDFNEIIKSLTPKEDAVSQEQKPEETAKEEAAPKQEEAPKEEEVSREYKNALKKAESYAKYMNMSKQGIYDQLTSEYGENFPEDAAQYAIDHLNVDYNKNALEKAKSYSNSMHMSEKAIYDQLISEYGEKFTEEEAQYAIDNLSADYNKNALEKAKSYSEMMAMSDAEIYDQLVSEYGEQFTPEQAQYAIDHLND